MGRIVVTGAINKSMLMSNSMRNIVQNMLKSLYRCLQIIIDEIVELEFCQCEF